jgi:hypothetical protein
VKAARGCFNSETFVIPAPTESEPLFDLAFFVEKGWLRRVAVLQPDVRVLELGTAESRRRFKTDMGGFTCGDNSMCVVDAMLAAGEAGWRVVPGFAVGGNCDLPSAHVWVAKGDRHFDPTWIRWGWDPSRLEYFEVMDWGTMIEEDPLRRIQKLATIWRIRLVNS